MYVIKRNGKKEEVVFDKIKSRLRKQCYQLDEKHIDPILVTQKVIDGIHAGILTSELDNLAAEIAASMSTKHYQYGILAARISISNLHKMTDSNFCNVVKTLYNLPTPILSKEFHDIVMSNENKIRKAIN